MIQIICDICKEEIPEATTTYSWESKERNYRQILDKAICYSCQAEFEKKMVEVMEEKAEFTLTNQTSVMKDVLESMTQ